MFIKSKKQKLRKVVLWIAWKWHKFKYKKRFIKSLPSCKYVNLLQRSYLKTSSSYISFCWSKILWSCLCFVSKFGFWKLVQRELFDFTIIAKIGIKKITTISFELRGSSENFVYLCFWSRTTIVWPFFVYSKMAMFYAKNRAFRVIQHYEHHIFSESSHQEQSFKKIKMICHVSISKINFI